MKVLLTGANGQIGTALQKYRPDGLELLLVQRKPSELAAVYQCDLSQVAQVSDLLTGTAPDLIINAAAWTDVDGAEGQTEAAAMLNTALPAQLANYAAKHAIPLVHYSSDYVYSGKKKKPWKETDDTDPQSVYGKTKLAGDQIIKDSGCDYLILRTSWVYGGPGTNFLCTIADKLLEGEELTVVNDQYGCPTWCEDIAQCTWHALADNLRLASEKTVQPAFKSGLYHLAGQDAGSWYDFAEVIRQRLIEQGKTALLPTKVAPCRTKAFSRPAPRPKSSVLNSNAFANRYNCQPGGWQSVKRCVDNLYG